MHSWSVHPVKERLWISSPMDWTPVYIIWCSIFASLWRHLNADRCPRLTANVERSYTDEEASRVRSSRARVHLLLEGTTEQDRTSVLDGTRNSMARDYVTTKHLLVNLVIIPSTLRGHENAFHLYASRSCAMSQMPVSAHATLIERERSWRDYNGEGDVVTWL